MWQAVRTGGTVVAAGLTLAMAVAPVRAASDVDVNVGGYQDQALAEVHRDLLGPVVLDGRYSIRLESGQSSALTAFTPRLGGLGLGGTGHVPAYGLSAGGDAAPTSTGAHSLLVGLSGTEIAGWAVDLAATAGVVNPAATTGTGDSGLVVGGQLAVSGLRFDAAYGEDAAAMGFDGTRMSAGVTYGIGPLDTRLGYSVVDRQTEVDTSLFTVGSRLTLKSGLVVQGDVAYADDDNGDVTTAGRVSLQLNF